MIQGEGSTRNAQIHYRGQPRPLGNDYRVGGSGSQVKNLYATNCATNIGDGTRLLELQGVTVIATIHGFANSKVSGRLYHENVVAQTTRQRVGSGTTRQRVGPCTTGNRIVA